MASLVIANLSMFFIFLHTVGFYEKYASNERGDESKYDIQMYAFHSMAVIAFILVTVKFGRSAACAVEKFMDWQASTCADYNALFISMAIATYVLTLLAVQKGNILSEALIKIDDPLSHENPYKPDREIAYGFYLIVVLVLGFIA